MGVSSTSLLLQHPSFLISHLYTLQVIVLLAKDPSYGSYQVPLNFFILFPSYRQPTPFHYFKINHIPFYNIWLIHSTCDLPHTLSFLFFSSNNPPNRLNSYHVCRSILFLPYFIILDKNYSVKHSHPK